MARHGESVYQDVVKRRNRDPLWKEFITEFNKDHRMQRTRELAAAIMEKYPLPYSDYETPLTEFGKEQARSAGLLLQTKIPLPDIVLVSPYLRYRQTLDGLTETWPELKTVRRDFDERLEERDIGIGIMYNNWRLFQTFHPEQKDFYDRLGPTAYFFYAHPQGQSPRRMQTDDRSLLTTLIREYAGKCVLLVTHHVRILTLRATIERMTPEEFVALDREDPPQNCSLTIYEGEPELGAKGKLVRKEYNVVAENNK